MTDRYCKYSHRLSREDRKIVKKLCGLESRALRRPRRRMYSKSLPEHVDRPRLTLVQFIPNKAKGLKATAVGNEGDI